MLTHAAAAQALVGVKAELTAVAAKREALEMELAQAAEDMKSLHSQVKELTDTHAAQAKELTETHAAVKEQAGKLAAAEKLLQDEQERHAAAVKQGTEAEGRASKTAGLLAEAQAELDAAKKAASETRASLGGQARMLTYADVC